jgi:phosphoglycolate phosphatase-like HAD superfamily hydrolase
VKVETLPVHEELDALARHYHHLQVQHQNASPGSSARRHLEDKLLRVRERLDRALVEWVPEEDLRQAWRAYLEHHGPEPSGPPAIRPVVFRGRSDVTGSIVEIRVSGDELRVDVDGALIERVAAKKDFASTEPVVSFRLNGNDYDELFEASEEAFQALAEFLERGESPPWDHAHELLADGLVDVHFALTPRGHRALADWKNG